VDCDVKPDIDGRLNYIDFLENHGLDPNLETFMVQTPSGGMHLYYRPPEDKPLGNTAGKLAPGIDTRSSGGYVVGPGSATSAGLYSIYRELPIAAAPDALVEAADGTTDV
jgi:hypothetical protein